jgi:hypothetical protein
MVGKLDWQALAVIMSLRGWPMAILPLTADNSAIDSGWIPSDARPLFKPGDELHIHATGVDSIATQPSTTRHIRVPSDGLFS